MIFPVLSLIAAQAAASPLTYGPSFERFFQIVFENEDAGNVLEDPYFKDLASRGRYYSNFHAVTHPSQPNYIAMIGGDRRGVWLDFNWNVKGDSLVDLLEAKSVSWTTYQENYPGYCFDGEKSGTYRRKHNPFISFDTIRKNPARCDKIVNADQLKTDIANKAVPKYVFYTPDMNNDGHDTSIAYSSSYLKEFLEPLLSNPYFKKTLFFITFDENEHYLQKNIIYSVAIGHGVAAGSIDAKEYSHYSVLAMIEQRWRLGNLGLNDAKACPLEIA